MDGRGWGEEELTIWTAGGGEVMEVELHGCAVTGSRDVDVESAFDGAGGWERGGVAYV